MHDIQLGWPTDLLVDIATWKALGFVVRCGDDSVRFLPYAAAQPSGDEIAVASPLVLLEDVGFYATRGLAFRTLVGCEVGRDDRVAGVLRDLIIRAGTIEEIEVESGGVLHRVPAVSSTVAAERAAA
jgi:hypothetical protein